MVLVELIIKKAGKKGEKGEKKLYCGPDTRSYVLLLLLERRTLPGVGAVP
jgi:hypothetical protein